MALEVSEENRIRFWYWVTERHRIYLMRQTGVPAPWSHDPIFQNYRFPNVYRNLDKGTAWALNWYPQGYGDLPTLIFNVCVYRLLNRIEVVEEVGYTPDYFQRAFVDKLDAITRSGAPVYTGVYTIPGRKGYPKHLSTAMMLQSFWEDRRVLHEASLKGAEALYKKFLTYFNIGPFLAYQFVLDLIETPVLANAPDRYTWVILGHGAQRGLRRIFTNLKMPSSHLTFESSWVGPGGKIKVHIKPPFDQYRRDGKESDLDGLMWLLQDSLNSLTPDMPAFNVHDVEGALCEYDKYARVFYGQGAPRCKYDARGTT